MLPTLPDPLPPRPHRRAARPAPPLLLALALALGLPAPGRALDVTLAPPREQGGYVWVDVALSDLFSPRIQGSLERGMPGTLLLHAELWRRRTGWFDRLESSFEASIRIHFDFRQNAYLVERAGAAPLPLPTLDSVRTVLSRPLALPVGRIGPLQPDQRYYAVVSVTLKPLSVEDAEEVEGWLSGEVEEKRSEPFGVITALPRSLFDAVRNFAGFGDAHARAIGGDFGLRDLFPKK